MCARACVCDRERTKENALKHAHVCLFAACERINANTRCVRAGVSTCVHFSLDF